LDLGQRIERAEYPVLVDKQAIGQVACEGYDRPGWHGTNSVDHRLD